MRPTSPQRDFDVAERPEPSRHEPSLFASSIEEPRPRSGVSIWLAAAAALVMGIGIGFASGYRAGKGSTSVPAAAIENPAGATGGQPFSESSVPEPVKLNPEPAPSAPAGPQRGLTPAAAPAPQTKERQLKPAAEPATRSREQGQPTEGRPANAPTAVGRVPPRIQAVAPSTTLRAPRAESRGAADPPEPAVKGPASLEVLSRPSGAQVILDGRAIGKTPMTIPDVAAGFHDIRLELSGFKGWSTTVGVKPGIATRVAASLEQ